jgi:AcrR family transcriptional regulator
MTVLNAKENRKIRYTKMAIRNSLMELLKEKQILSITTKEICVRADISRSTFYTYYKDQYDLLKQIEDEILETICGMVVEEKNPAKRTSQDNIAKIERLFQFILDNKASLQSLLGRNGDYVFQKKFLSLFIERMKKYAPENFKKPEDEAKREYFSNFVVGGFVAIVQTWLQNNINLSVPELAKLTAQLFHIHGNAMNQFFWGPSKQTG